MAILQKIRNQSILLLVVVGLALLAFLIGDFLNSGATYFNKSRENVAEINGEGIHYTEYQAAINQMTEVYKIESGVQSLDENLTNQIRRSVWESLVNEKLLNAEAEKLGLTVTTEELSDRLIGNNIHPLIMQRRAFVDENGTFSRNVLLNFVSVVNSDDAESNEQINQLRQYWLFWENAVRTSILQEKYLALLNGAISANAVDAKLNFEGRKENIAASYVMQPYYALSDSLFAVSDNEVKKLYHERKEQYKQEPYRNILYATFEIVPSQEDFDQAKADCDDLYEEFCTSDDVIGLVNRNSDVPYTGYYYSEATVPAELKDFAFSNAVNAVTPVMFDGKKYTMARILETGIQMSDSVKLRHIYLQNSTQAFADSLENVLKSGADFAELAAKYSAVAQTAKNGGEIGWVSQTTVPEEVFTPAFTKNANDIFVLGSGSEFQIFQIMEKSPATPKVRLAIYQHEVVPSSRTQSNLYNEAKQFIVENDTREKFEAAAKEKAMALQSGYNLHKNDEKVGQLEQSRPIVRWAFEAKEGAVSDVVECGDYFVVATLVKASDSYFRPIEDVAAELRMELRNDKKAEQLKTQLAGQSLEQVAQTINSDIKTAEAVNMASYRFGSAGMEPYVIGATTVLKAGETSAPLKGNTGVYVVRVDSVSALATTYDEASEIMQMNMRMSYSFPYMVMQDLREDAEIEDNRFNFY